MKHFIGLLFIATLLGCQPVTSLNICRIHTAAPVSLDKIFTLINDSLMNTTLSGWTVYPVKGGWRNAPDKAFMQEDAVVIELLSKDNISHEADALAKQLEKALHQEKVIFYCTKA